MIFVELNTTQAQVLQNILLGLLRKDPDNDDLKRLAAILSRAFEEAGY